MWDATKTVPRGKFSALNTYSRKQQQRFKINDSNFYLKKFEEGKQLNLIYKEEN